MTSKNIATVCVIQLLVYVSILPHSLSQITNIINCQPQGNVRVVNLYEKIFNIYDITIIGNVTNYNAATEHQYTGNDLPRLQQSSNSYVINNITFIGYVRPDDEIAKEKKNVQIDTIITANVQYKKTFEYNDDYTYLTRRHCSVGFIEMYNPGTQFNELVDAVILELVESCVQSQVCHYIDEDPQVWSTYNVQKSINEIADGIGETLVKTLIKPNTRLPNIAGTYNYGFVTLRFNGTGASFINSPDVKRAADVYISHDGLQFTLGIDFSLYRLNLHFDDFSVSLLMGTSTGETSVYVSRVTFGAKVSVDYNQTPCKLVLEDLDIYDYGPIKVYRPDSSLYPLRNESSGMVDSVVLSKARNITLKILTDSLVNFNCDDFSIYDKQTAWDLFWDNIMASITK